MFMGMDDSIPNTGTPTLSNSKNLPTPDSPNRPTYKTDRTALLSPKIDLIMPETCRIGVRSTRGEVFITPSKKKRQSLRRPDLACAYVHVEKKRREQHERTTQPRHTSQVTVSCSGSHLASVRSRKASKHDGCTRLGETRRAKIGEIEKCPHGCRIRRYNLDKVAQATVLTQHGGFDCASRTCRIPLPHGTIWRRYRTEPLLLTVHSKRLRSQPPFSYLPNGQRDVSQPYP